MTDEDFDDTNFDPAAEAEFESELLTDDLDLFDDDIVVGEHLSIEQLAEREQDAEDYYAQHGAAWDDV